MWLSKRCHQMLSCSSVLGEAYMPRGCKEGTMLCQVHTKRLQCCSKGPAAAKAHVLHLLWQEPKGSPGPPPPVDHHHHQVSTQSRFGSVPTADSPGRCSTSTLAPPTEELHAELPTGPRLQIKGFGIPLSNPCGTLTCWPGLQGLGQHMFLSKLRPEPRTLPALCLQCAS